MSKDNGVELNELNSLVEGVVFTFDDLKKKKLKELEELLAADDGTNKEILQRFIADRIKFRDQKQAEAAKRNQEAAARTPDKSYLSPNKPMRYIDRMKLADKDKFSGDWDDLPGSEDYRDWRKRHR